MIEDSNARKITDVTDLEVFRKAYKISLEVHKLSLEFPKYEQFELASQMRRASKSICANLAEGFGKQSTSAAEFKRYVHMAIGSADEMQLWIKYCKDLDYMPNDLSQKYRDEYKSIARMLMGLYKRWM